MFVQELEHLRCCHPFPDVFLSTCPYASASLTFCVYAFVSFLRQNIFPVFLAVHSSLSILLPSCVTAVSVRGVSACVSCDDACMSCNRSTSLLPSFSCFAYYNSHAHSHSLNVEEGNREGNGAWATGQAAATSRTQTHARFAHVACAITDARL